MPIVQMTTKLRRNAPCHCGSGKKYKKCCGKKEQKKMTEEKKIITGLNAPASELMLESDNDPYAGIPEDELVTRDQAVLLKELRFREGVRKANIEGIGKVIEDAKVLLVELLAMPKSPYREICIADVRLTTENNKKSLEVQVVPRSITLTLLALEELFAEDKASQEPVEQQDKAVLYPDASASVPDDDLTIPDDQPGDGVDREDKTEQAI